MHSSGYGKIQSVLKGTSLTKLRDDDFRETQLLEEDIPFIQDELDNATTIFYLMIEGVRNDPTTLEAARQSLRK
jgi:hypothetical protein